MMTYMKSLMENPGTKRWLFSLMHYKQPGAALVDEFIQEGVHPAREAADAVLEHMERERVITRCGLSMNASQRFFDTKGDGKRRNPEHTAPATFFAWKAASGGDSGVGGESK